MVVPAAVGNPHLFQRKVCRSVSELKLNRLPSNMDKAGLKSYEARWKLLNERQKKERAKMTMEEKYQTMVSIHRLAASIGRPAQRNEKSEQLVWETWKVLRERFSAETTLS